MNSDNKIILLSEIYKRREEKEKELAFYSEKLKELKTKLFFVQKEIEITDFIIRIIENEKVTIIGDVLHQQQHNNTQE